MQKLGYSAIRNNGNRFRVRAQDSAGHWSAWVMAVQPNRIRLYDDRSAAVKYTGTWTRKAYTYAANKTLTASSVPGSRVTMTFSGRGIAVVGPRSLSHGRAQVFVDGVYITTINMRTLSSPSRMVAFTRSFANGGQHRIRLVVVGKDPVPLFRLDAFVISK